MDFFSIREREGGTQKKPVLEIYPDFKVKRSNDLMIRGKAFYAVWDEVAGLWVTDEYAVAKLVDKELRKYESTTTGFYEEKRKYMNDFESRTWLSFRNYLAHLTDHFVQLDESITFKNTRVVKEDYVSRRLPYDLKAGDISAWDELVSTLYNPEDRRKIEWAFGAVLTGDAKTIQKFLVFYGPMGSGKSTIMNILEMLVEGYFVAFVAKELTAANNSFALEAFKTNPLVAIEHDGDLSKIQDNTRLNSLVSHEWMLINEKNKPTYTARFNAMMFIGSNNPVKITDGKSGLIRRLIDVHPSGRLLSAKKYHALMNQIKFEIGAIAHHCVSVYQELGKNYYSDYRPTEMMLQTDMFYNFIEDSYDTFAMQPGVSLNQAFMMYKEFVKDSEFDFSINKMKFREELKNYFTGFEERAPAEHDRVRSWYTGFTADRFKVPTGKPEDLHQFSLVMEETESIFDKTHADCPAQYANSFGKPSKKWTVTEEEAAKGMTPVTTTLKDLDTTRLHFVLIPDDEIVIDFDLTDGTGKKSAERNLEKASQWKPTYAEFSKSGNGIHLHYTYVGDTSELSALYDEGIEVLTLSGSQSLRRKLSFCNNVEIAEMQPGFLPLKEKKVMNDKQIKDEAHIRALINKNLRKEVHSGTKSSVDFIHQILEEAYASGATYNVSDMKQRITNFAMGSTNQAIEALRKVSTMKFASEDAIEAIEIGETPDSFKAQKTLDADTEVIYDVEVFPNLFVVCWKYKGAPRDSVVTLINPSQRDIEKMLPMKLVGFFNRQYDNHIMYAAAMGYTIPQLYDLSKRLVNNETSRNAKFGAAYDLSYADIYDVAAIKQSLKKWQIALGITHLELGLDWDTPVPKELWPKVAEYCANDVDSTDVVREHLEADFIARAILAEISGLSMNSTTQQHAAKIAFGDTRYPQDDFVYTDLSEMFPGYTFQYNETTKKMQSVYHGYEAGEGGFVYSEPGIYENVEVYDVESMHPTSIGALNLFGKHTKNYMALLEARVAIKNGDYEKARTMFGGRLARYLNDESLTEALSYALKIVINIVYGLTSASFPNAFRDPKNIDNIVAKRGALFMIELLMAVKARGWHAIHIKTDSIKMVNPTDEQREFIFEFGKKYGYKFVHEATYSKIALINKAVYVALVGWAEKAKKIGKWEAVGKEFQRPVVYKTLFTHEPIKFEDYCEGRSVLQGAMYLDYTGLEDTPADILKDLNEQNMRFIGKNGQFTPMLPGTGGGILIRVKDEKHYAVPETKGYFWSESEVVKHSKKQADINKAYFEKQVEEAKLEIAKFGDVEAFLP